MAVSDHQGSRGVEALAKSKVACFFFGLPFLGQGVRSLDGSGQLCFVHCCDKDYKVLLAKRPDKDQLDAWKRGVVLEDGYKSAPADVRFESAQGKGAWVHVVMGEGRKRQIREICQQLGLPVVRIVRVLIGTLRLGNLKPRQWRYLTTKEDDELKQPISKE